MSYTSLCSVRYRILLAAFIFIAFLTSTYAQVQKNPVPKEYDAAMKRMLIRSTASYIHGIGQGEIDLDSATLMSAEIFSLGRLLAYDEEYAGNSDSPSAKLIQQGKISSVKKMLRSAKGPDQFELLANLANYYLYKSGTLQADLDSAQVFVQQLYTLSESSDSKKWHMISLSLFGQLYLQRHNISESQKYYALAVSSARQQSDEVQLMKALADQGSNLPFASPSKLELLQEAVALSRKLSYKIKEIEILTEILKEHFRTNPGQAEKELLQLVELQQSLGYKHIQYTHDVLAYIYTSQSSYVEAMDHAEKALKYMEATHDVALSSVYYLRMSTLLMQLQKNEEAFSWIDRALALKKTDANKIFWYKSFLQKAHWMTNMNRTQEALTFIQDIVTEFPPRSAFDRMHTAFLKGVCFQKANQPDKSAALYEEFASIADHFPPEYIFSEIPGAFTQLGYFYFLQKDFSKAKSNGLKAMDIAQKKGSVAGQMQIHLLFFKLDSASRDYFSALKNYQQYKWFHDSVFNLSQRNKINELAVKYETAKKDQNIQILTQQGELKETKLQQANTARNITFGGVGLLLVIVGLLYNQYRIKKLNNQQLQHQQQEISQKNKTLMNLLDEKEWLVKEIHHRVKNNLHTIVSLLESQSAYLGNDALAAVRDSQHRVYAMSLIHQKLYLSDNVTTIDMSVYIKELVNYLRDSFNTGQRIHFELDIDAINLDVGTAIPLGLILNEAITNSIKYAFPENTGVITLALNETNEHFLLTIADNGIGLPPDFDNLKTNSLGMRLMKGLSKEIEATFEIKNSGGTMITITFTDDSLLIHERPGGSAITREEELKV